MHHLPSKKVGPDKTRLPFKKVGQLDCTIDVPSYTSRGAAPMPSYPRMAAFWHNYSGKPAHGQAALVFWCCMSAASLPAWPLMTSPQVGQRIVIVHPFRPLTSASKKGVGAACPVARLVLREAGIGGSSSSTCSHSSPATPRVLL